MRVSIGPKKVAETGTLRQLAQAFPGVEITGSPLGLLNILNNSNYHTRDAGSGTYDDVYRMYHRKFEGVSKERVIQGRPINMTEPPVRASIALRIKCPVQITAIVLPIYRQCRVPNHWG